MKKQLMVVVICSVLMTWCAWISAASKYTCPSPKQISVHVSHDNQGERVCTYRAKLNGSDLVLTHEDRDSGKLSCPLVPGPVTSVVVGQRDKGRMVVSCGYGGTGYGSVWAMANITKQKARLSTGCHLAGVKPNRRKQYVQRNCVHSPDSCIIYTSKELGA